MPDSFKIPQQPPLLDPPESLADHFQSESDMQTSMDKPSLAEEAHQLNLTASIRYYRGEAAATAPCRDRRPTVRVRDGAGTAVHVHVPDP